MLVDRGDADGVGQELVDVAVGGEVQVAEADEDGGQASVLEVVGEVEGERRLAAAGRALNDDQVLEVGVVEEVDDRVEQGLAAADLVVEGVDGLLRLRQVAPADLAAVGGDVDVGQGEGFAAEDLGGAVLPAEPGVVGGEVVGRGHRAAGQAVDGGDDPVVVGGDLLEVGEDVAAGAHVDRDHPETRVGLAGGEDRPLAAAPGGGRGVGAAKSASASAAYRAVFHGLDGGRGGAWRELFGKGWFRSGWWRCR